MKNKLKKLYKENRKLTQDEIDEVNGHIIGSRQTLLMIIFVAVVMTIVVFAVWTFFDLLGYLIKYLMR